MKRLMTGLVLAVLATGYSAQNDWENTRVNAINREPARAYSMPLADEKAALTDELEPQTPYRLSLNGIWKISWCGNPSLRPLDFWKPDYNDADWLTIDVPSCVEMRGFGSPGYTNVRYPHLNKWPYILDRDTKKPDYNPVSSYRRTFTVPEGWKGRDVFLRFDGVYSAYYVWVNGKKVGYAEDSKLPSEFNITRYLVPGENQLSVEVYRWCDGSYLEDQDMFRFSGIYRDVTLFATPRTELNDFFVTTTFDKDYQNANLRVAVKARSLNGQGGQTVVSARLYDAAFQEVAVLPAVKFFVPTTGAMQSETLSVQVAKPRLWSAEDPYLYTLVLTLRDQKTGATDVRAARMGFKEVKIVGNAVLFNGRKIKFKGVNRHECNPDNGRTVSMDDMLKDILLFKRYNINTVRTSHYPNHHSWYKLCDKYGIYVVAEANVEGHEPGYDKDGLGHQEPWFGTIVERNVNHVMNYRNHASVAIWSLGNETGHGKGFVDAAAGIRKLGVTQPIHWERGNVDADVDSTMYPSVEWLDERGRLGDGLHKAKTLSRHSGNTPATVHTANKPFFLCEYAHAMGNAIGNFQEYWEVFYKYDSLSGGCIWDWVDQAIWKETDRVCPKTGKRERFLTYGGDFDEFPNDGPFCCNGVVDPFRNVTAKLVEVAHVHRNLVVEKFDAATGVATLWNRFGFTPANQFNGAWELLKDGERVTSGTFVVPPVAPLSRGTFTVAVPAEALAGAGEYFINFSFALASDTIWAKAGHTVARDQLLVKKVAPAAAAASAGDRPTVVENEKTVTVTAENLKAVFCRTSGTLCELAFNGRTVLKDLAPGVTAGPQFTCQRAFVDNDRWLRDGSPWGIDRKASFYASGLTQLRYHARPIRVTFPVEKAVVCVKTAVAVTGSKSAGFEHETLWTFAADGTVTAKNTVTPHGVMPPALPRLGTTWKLDKALENMSYYGRGPRENYIDRCTGSFVGRWNSTVTEQFEAYVRPQDNGYKTDVRSVRFTDDDGYGVEFSADRPLFVQALHYGLDDLEAVRHLSGERRYRRPLVAREEVVLNLDVRQLGLGGASCGPQPMAKYRFPIQKETWTITVKPVKGRSLFFGLF